MQTKLRTPLLPTLVQAPASQQLSRHLGSNDELTKMHSHLIGVLDFASKQRDYASRPRRINTQPMHYSINLIMALAISNVTNQSRVETAKKLASLSLSLQNLHSIHTTTNLIYAFHTHRQIKFAFHESTSSVSSPTGISFKWQVQPALRRHALR